MKLTKNDHLDKYKYNGYGKGFGSCSEFLLSDDSMGKIVIIFGADMSSSVHIENKWKDILFLGKGSKQGLDDAAITAEAKYPINFTKANKRFVSSLHYNRSILFVNATKIHQFKAKNSIMYYVQSKLQKILQFITWKKSGLRAVVKFLLLILILSNCF